MLVVKNKKYVEISRVCVESFFYHNPGSKVVIHCDDLTIYELQRRYARRLSRGDLHLNHMTSSENISWQEMKMQVLLHLNGTRDFFMDADLRWNGALPKFEGIQFFVKEFQLKDHVDYRKILGKLENPRYGNAYMWNTSFFSFGGSFEEIAELDDLLALEKKVIAGIDSENLVELEKPWMRRISEQLAFSIYSENWSEKRTAIKLTDGHKDGSFLESSYFGATGTHF
jgi:hypothetical protein